MINIGKLPEIIGSFKHRNKNSNAWLDTKSNVIALIHDDGRISFGTALPAGCSLGRITVNTEEEVIEVISSFVVNRKKNEAKND